MVRVYISLILTSTLASLTNAFVVPSTGIGAFVGRVVAPTKPFTPCADTSLCMVATKPGETPPMLSDDILKLVLKDTAINAGITDYDEETCLAAIKGSLEANKDMSYEGIGSMVIPADDKFDSAVFAESSLMSLSVASSSDFGTSSLTPCDWALFDFAIEAVSLAMTAAGMPGGASKKVAKILVKKARKRLMKEMKSIIKDYFGSPDPFNIAAGLGKIMGIIIGEISFSDVANAVYDSVSWWDAIKIVATLTLYFVSGGAGLAAKLGLMLPALFDIVEAGVEVGKTCG